MNGPLVDQTNGVFIEQIKNDHTYFGNKFNLSQLKDTSKDVFKSKIKKIIKKVGFNEYVKEKRNMKKLSKLIYTKHKKTRVYCFKWTHQQTKTNYF